MVWVLVRTVSVLSVAGRPVGRGGLWDSVSWPARLSRILDDVKR